MSTEGHDAGAVLFGRTRQRVLGLLLGHPDERYYLRQIARQTGSAQGAVQRELSALTGAGILERTPEGRQVYFRAARQSPIFPELRGLVLKTAGLVDVLRDALASIGGKIDLAFVFGSAARGQLTSDSDVDLLVVADVSFEAVATSLVAAQERLARDVNPTVYSAQEFRAKLRAGHHFLTSIVSGPRLFVIGGVDELGRLGAQRVVDRPHDERKRSARPAGSGGTRPRRQRRVGPQR